MMREGERPVHYVPIGGDPLACFQREPWRPAPLRHSDVRRITCHACLRWLLAEVTARIEHQAGQEVEVRHLYATAWGAADDAPPDGSRRTLCGLPWRLMAGARRVPSEVPPTRVVHSSKARRSDCPECRKVLRARVWHSRGDVTR